MLSSVGVGMLAAAGRAAPMAGLGLCHAATVVAAGAALPRRGLSPAALAVGVCAQLCAGAIAALSLPTLHRPLHVAFAIASLLVPCALAAAAAVLAAGAVAYALLWPVARLSELFGRRFRARNFAGKHALVTGGGTGLGRAIAVRLAAEGAHVSVVSRSPAHLADAAAEATHAARVAASGGSCRWFVADVRDPAAVGRAVDAAAAAQGGRYPQIVFANAGLAHPQLFSASDPASFREEMDLNFHGTVNVLCACVPHMQQQQQEQGWRALAIVSSAMGLMGGSGYSAYCATKYALRGLADSLRYELGPRGIGVHLLLPSNMDTPGYAIENRSKSAESRIFDERAVTVSPDRAAQMCIEGVRRGEYTTTTAFDVELVRISCNGTAPATWPVLEFFLAPILWIGVGLQRITWERKLRRFAVASS